MLESSGRFLVRAPRSLLVLALFASLALSLACGGATSSDSWTRWGGPTHDFKAASTGLAEEWPETGPPALWSRDLGEGYSAVLYDSGQLYTMHRNEGQEVVIAMDAKTGETSWEYRYDASPKEGHVTQFGEGPRSTPLLAGDRLYTIGVSGVMHSLNKDNGEVAWSHDLWGEEFGGSFLNHGYSSSPIEYRDNVIVLVGGEGASIVAFNKQDGGVAWKALDYKNSYSTPRIVEIDGEQQLVTYMAHHVIGVDPNNGDLKWEYEHQNQFEQNINQPVILDDILFLSTPQAGAKGLRLTNNAEGTTDVEEVWATRKIQFYHVTSVLDGDYVYGSTGMQGPAFMSAVNVKTGEIAWRKRGFAKANCLYADGKLFILDEDGKLAITTATPEDLTVHSEANMLDDVAWTVPTIVGKTMFLRDKGTLMAVDLG